jgi:hypothetical protein
MSILSFSSTFYMQFISICKGKVTRIIFFFFAIVFPSHEKKINLLNIGLLQIWILFQNKHLVIFKTIYQTILDCCFNLFPKTLRRRCILSISPWQIRISCSNLALGLLYTQRKIKIKMVEQTLNNRLWPRHIINISIVSFLIHSWVAVPR